jgi:NAD(P)-dependent dehydrogenase (short-subunit alcohol dehydrogenase family)
MVPLTTIVKSQFITSQAAARLMIPQRAGVIIFLTGSPARAHVKGATAIGAAFGAIENFMANLAIELGEAGVRSVCLRTTANTDTRTIQTIMESIAQHSGQSKADVTAMLASYNFLKVPAVMNDTAKAIAFLASDDAPPSTERAADRAPLGGWGPPLATMADGKAPSTSGSVAASRTATNALVVALAGGC